MIENTPGINRELPRKLSFLPEIAALILTFLLPLKFGGIVGLPEMPMIYWQDFMGIFVGAWPIALFPIFSLLLLILTLFFAFPRKTSAGSFPSGAVYSFLWLLLAGTAFAGMKNASTWDFVTSFLPYFSGIGCFTFSIYLLLENNPAFGKKLFIAMGISFLFVLHCALNQYFVGFREMEEYLAKQAKESGKELSLAFRRRLDEARVTADFAAGNVFAGYLLLVFPMVFAILWKWGGKVTPPLLTRIVLLLPAAGLFFFLLNATKSRGCFLSLLGGLFLTCIALRPGKKFMLLLYGGAAAALGGFITLIAFDRGPRSIIFRMDYFQGALRMMWENLLFGAGWGEFFHDFHRLKLHFNDESPHSPHNFLLTLGSQTGILPFLIGTAILGIPLAAAFILLYKEAGKREKGSFGEPLILKAGLLTSLGCWTFHSLGEIDLEVPGSLGSAILISLLTLSCMEKNNGKLPFLPLPEKRSFQWGLLLLSLLLAGLCAGTIFTISPKNIAGEIAFEELIKKCSSVSRYNGTIQFAHSMEEIQESLRVCSEILPRSPFPWDRAANAAAMRGVDHAPIAFALLREAMKRAPERGAYAYRMYLAMRKLGRKEEAEKYLEEAKKLSPKNINYYKYLPPDEDIEKNPFLW